MKDNNFQDTLGRTRLHYEKGGGLLDRVISEYPEWINFQDNEGLTPLHFGVIHDDLNKVETLLKHGANLDIEDAWGNIPLNRVRYGGRQFEIARLLVLAGSRVEHVNLYGSSPVRVAKLCSNTMGEFIDLYKRHKSMSDWRILDNPGEALIHRIEINRLGSDA